MNQQLFYFFYGFAHQSVALDNAIYFTAHTLPYLMVLIVMIFLLKHHEVIVNPIPSRKLWEKRREMLDSFVTASVAWCVGSGLKILIRAPRPAFSLPDIHPLIEKLDYSFPSGHATFFMALAFSIFLFHKRAGYVFIVLAFLIGLGRIASGVHYPIDIIGGWALGILIAYISKKITKQKYRI